LGTYKERLQKSFEKINTAGGTVNPEKLEGFGMFAENVDTSRAASAD
jgi:hypothetical protein